MAGDVFDDDDGVVYNKSGADGERHEREIVQAVVAQIHDAERSDERQRNGDTRNNRRPSASEKSEHDEDHQYYGNHQRDFDVVYRSANRGGAIHGDAQVEGRRDRGTQHWQKNHNAVDGFDHVRRRLAGDSQEYGAVTSGKTQIPNIRG